MLQFYGLSFKENREILGLKKEKLENKNLQYEMPLIALQTKPFTLGKNVISFYGLYIPNHEEILEEPYKVEIDYINKNEKIKELNFTKPLIGNVINGLSVSHPSKNRLFIEYNKESRVIAFFDENKHNVKKEKELLTERMHGHLMISGDILNAGTTMASTNFETVFSQTVSLLEILIFID